jgi:gliding motility-associated lipoprotein GldH
MARTRNKVISLLSVVLALTITSCNNNAVFQDSVEMKKTVRHYNEPAEFEFSMKDSINHYDMLVNIRNGTDYAYNNMWLFVTYEYPNDSILTDTVECPLAYSNGEWIGSGIGDVVDNLVMFKQDVRFPRAGNYKVSIRHGMRNDDLKAVHSIGLRVQRAL